ncbi:unnamed protein product [Brassicogethes aeneus]|uniref:Fibronectin type-III domain-containing protein n=1 Tax=Brassicogethes aeneus TaxID=1431903 RepID=A0A9P0AT15_BRAAE|nr:unnamed protein product [Brassicogethes aeneus]
MQLDTTERRIMESRGSRHTLMIRKVHRTDFGNYTCVADNQLGKTRKSVQLTGKPNPVKFSSSRMGSWKDSYNISWAVESLSPIEEYKLLFRRIPETGTGEDAAGHSVSYGFVRRTDWRDVILPATQTQSTGVQSMSYVIRGLEANQNYEAKVQARNKFGWSPVSEAFTFQTTDTG